MGSLMPRLPLLYMGLMMLPSGEIDTLEIKADDIMLLDRAKLMEHWKSSLDPDASHDTVADEENENMAVSNDRADRARRAIPVFFGAWQGHSCCAHSKER
eukprot:6259278-Pyramimonas_sp.AAC.1